MGTIFSGFIARIVDKTKEFEKCGKLLLFMTCVIYFLLVFVMFEPERHVAIIILMMLLGMTSLSVFPIAQELVVETTYPVGSGTSCGFVWLCSQLSSSLFTFILMYVNYEIDLTDVNSREANISTCGDANSVVVMKIIDFDKVGELLNLKEDEGLMMNGSETSTSKGRNRRENDFSYAQWTQTV